MIQDYADLEKRLRNAIGDLPDGLTPIQAMARLGRSCTEAADAIAALTKQLEEAREAAYGECIASLEAAAKGAAENIHDAELGKKIAAAYLQQASIMRAFGLSSVRASELVGDHLEHGVTDPAADAEK